MLAVPQPCLPTKSQRKPLCIQLTKVVPCWSRGLRANRIRCWTAVLDKWPRPSPSRRSRSATIASPNPCKNVFVIGRFPAKSLKYACTRLCRKCRFGQKLIRLIRHGCRAPSWRRALFTTLSKSVSLCHTTYIIAHSMYRVLRHRLSLLLMVKKPGVTH